MRLATHNRWNSIAAGIFVLATATTLTAGGFHLSLEKPANADKTHAKDAVLLVRPYGCHEPAEAVISATAEGFVNGRRETIKLQLHAASKGVYAIRQQWPAEGVWLVAVRGSYLGAHRGALLELGPNGTVEAENDSARMALRVKSLFRELTAGDIDRGLQQLIAPRLAESHGAAN